MLTPDIKTAADLDAAIAQLELEQAAQLLLVKTQIDVAAEAAQPIQLIKGILLEATKSENWKMLLTDTAIAMGARYINRRNERRSKRKGSLIENLFSGLKDNFAVILKIKDAIFQKDTSSNSEEDITD